MEVRRKISSFSSPTKDQVADPADKAYAYVSPSAMCLQLGPEREAYSGGTTIVQRPRESVFFKGRIHTHRIIPMDGRPHLDGKIRNWNGDSRGHWEGETLVIDTTNLNGRTWFDHIGTFTSDEARLEERINFIDENTLHYEETITDPQVFTQPWTISLGWLRSPAETDIWYDDSRENCHIGLERQFNLGLKPYPEYSAIAPKK